MYNKKGSLVKNAILNTVKQCCVILFPLITFPYVSRILGANNYGKINFGQSIVSYITLIASLGIAQYAIREGAKQRSSKVELSKTINEIYTINIISMVIAFLIFGLLLALCPKLFDYRILLIIQVSVVLFITVGADWINSIYEDYFILTIRYIFFHGVAILFMFLFVKRSEDYIVYALITVLSSIIPNILNIFYIRRKYGIEVKVVNPKSVSRHLSPIMILFASSIASLIYINSDITILGILRNDNEVGLYSVSAKIYSLVKQLMNAFLYVAIPKISNELATGLKEEVQKQLNILLNILLTVTLPASVGMYLLSKNIILLLSGSEYIEAYSSLKILSIALFFSSLACFYINIVLLPLGKEKMILKATITSAIINIIFNFVLIPILSKDAAALTTILAEIIMVLYGIYYSKDDFKFNISRSLISGIICAGCVILIVIITQNYNLKYITQLIICIVFSIISYVTIMLTINCKTTKELIKAFRR